MTGSARDRAIEVVNAKLMSLAPFTWEKYADGARIAVDALAARPDVLHALAAPGLCPVPGSSPVAEPPADEMEEHFIDANERMGEALTQIGMALGLSRPGVGNTWGAPEILRRVESLRQRIVTGAEARDLPVGSVVVSTDAPVNDDLLHVLVRARHGWWDAKSEVAADLIADDVRFAVLYVPGELAPAPAAEPTPNPAALLRLAASGRREYAASGPPNDELLSHEAAAFEQAARIVEGDLSSLYGALPSWRWNEIPARAAVGTTPPQYAEAPDGLDFDDGFDEPTVAPVIVDALCGGIGEAYEAHLAHPEVADRIAKALRSAGLLAAGAAPDTAAEPRARAVADLIRKGLAHRLGITSLRPLDDADDLDWLLSVGRQIAALADVPAHPGVARVLARCDELDAKFEDMHRQYRAIGTAQLRALLAGGEQQ